MNRKLFLLALIILPKIIFAQLLSGAKPAFTHEDTLRGSLNSNRDWWDVLRYDIEVKPDFEKKTIEGKVEIKFKQLKKRENVMQIDLQQPLIIDSVKAKESIQTVSGRIKEVLNKILFNQQGNVCMLSVPEYYYDIIIYYHGKPQEAVKPPWDGGWIFKKDKLGRPWMSVAVQGLGASAWYPCKDHQSDEPDNGASLTVIVPDTLVAVANGRLAKEIQIQNSKLKSYKWEIKNPINNYCIVPYIGKYVSWTDTLQGEKGKLDLGYYCLDYNLDAAKKQFIQAKQTLRCFEHWFGPYPFYEDGYKLIEAPHLGMEHQSAVAYGNGFQNGYYGRDLSTTGLGMKWDFIIVHETGHEWFGNNITTKDIADMWVHESFTSYSEDLYTEWIEGKQAGITYGVGKRKLIENAYPIIEYYGVNKESESGTDIYYKGENLIATIRRIMNDDNKFRMMLRGLNKTFYHQTVTTKQIEDYISKFSGISFGKTFDQYLRTPQIPTLNIIKNNKINTIQYKWSNCIEGFNMPITLGDKTFKTIKPTTAYKTIKLTKPLQDWITANNLKEFHYINVEIK